MSKNNIVEINELNPARPEKSRRKTSKRQLEACRANGAKSKGPKTEEGKAISRLNAVKHNLYSDLLTLVGENQQLYEQFKLDHIARLDPRDALEHDLCAKLAHNSWRQNRAALIEAELFDMKMADQAPTWDRLPGGVRDTTAMALAYQTMVDEGRALDSIQRLEASLVRQYSIQFKLFNELRKRNDLPPFNAPDANCGNEPNPEIEHPEPEPQDPAPTPEPIAEDTSATAHNQRSAGSTATQNARTIDHAAHLPGAPAAVQPLLAHQTSRPETPLLPVAGSHILAAK